MEDLKIEDTDLYELLGLEPTASTKEIKKAYRKKALKCHPDKNQDNPDAAKLFHQLTKVLEILIDESARKAYDKVLKGKKEAELRNKELDGKRRKLKEDLEAREKCGTHRNKTDDEKLQEEIQRLRKEGSRQVQEEMEYVERKLREEALSDNVKYKVKLKWKADKGDSQNGGYTEEIVNKFLSKYGDITATIMSKKNGSALVEFANQRGAEMAVSLERGLLNNPLQLNWVDKAPPGHCVQSTTIKPSDYESVVLTRMRQAEERKRLIEEMMAAEDDET